MLIWLLRHKQVGEALDCHRTHSEIVEEGLKAVATLISEPCIVELLVKTAGLELVSTAMNAHPTSRDICLIGSFAILKMLSCPGARLGPGSTVINSLLNALQRSMDMTQTAFRANLATSRGRAGTQRDLLPIASGQRGQYEAAEHSQVQKQLELRNWFQVTEHALRALCKLTGEPAHSQDMVKRGGTSLFLCVL